MSDLVYKYNNIGFELKIGDYAKVIATTEDLSMMGLKNVVRHNDIVRIVRLGSRIFGSLRFRYNSVEAYIPRHYVEKV